MSNKEGKFEEEEEDTLEKSRRLCYDLLAELEDEQNQSQDDHNIEPYFGEDPDPDGLDSEPEEIIKIYVSIRND